MHTWTASWISSTVVSYKPHTLLLWWWDQVSWRLQWRQPGTVLIILCVSCHVVSYRGLHLIADVALFCDIAIAIINYLYWILLTMDHAIFSHPRCKRRTEKLVRSNDSSPGFKPPRPVVRKIQFMASELLSCHTSRLLIDPTDTAFHTSGMFSGCCTSEGDTEPQHHTMLVSDFCFLADN